MAISQHYLRTAGPDVLNSTAGPMETAIGSRVLRLGRIETNAGAAQAFFVTRISERVFESYDSWSREKNSDNVMKPLGVEITACSRDQSNAHARQIRCSTRVL